MKKEYRFSKSKNANSVKDVKVIKTFRLDPVVISWLESEGEKQGMGYQTFLNWYLLKSIKQDSSIEERLERLERIVYKKS